MRLMEVLPEKEAKRFNQPPAFNGDDRKNHFKLDDLIREAIEKAKQTESQIGLLLQYGYFKASGKFFTSKSFKSADIKFASKILDVTAPTDFLEKYTDRMHQKHRLFILDICGHVDFGSAVQLFEESVGDMVENKCIHENCFIFLLIS